MVVTTAIVGDSLRNDPSLSSASATRKSPWPSLALVPRAFRRPPMTMVGSSPPRARTLATMEVVVVFPWVPATATPYFIRMSSASISRPLDHGDEALPGRHQLHIVRGHRRRADHHVGLAHVLGRVADGHPDPQRHETPRVLGLPAVGATDRIAQVVQDLGDAAHPDAADAHEMNPPDPLEHDFALPPPDLSVTLARPPAPAGPRFFRRRPAAPGSGPALPCAPGAPASPGPPARWRRCAGRRSTRPGRSRLRPP